MEEPIKQEEKTGRDSDQKNSDNFNPVKLTRLIEPTIEPTKIEYDVQGVPERFKKELAKGFGTNPFIDYNGVQLEYTDVKYFELYHEGILPAIKINFIDSKGLFRGEGFPLDDTKITIFIYSRSRKLRSIYMDFKITSFKDLAGEYQIHGICDVPQIFLRKFSSYKDKTSFQALQEIAKECEIGFCSNINDSDDKMTWVNIGKTRYNFIKEITQHSYLSDSTFLYCYVDFYYNLCYVELEKELNRNIKDDMMIVNTGKGDIINDPTLDEEIANLIITTDSGSKGTSAYVSEYKISNLSTKISLSRSYSSRTKFYDSKSKELLIFDIDSISSEGDKIVLKGKPQDMDFYKENIDTRWVGKIDEYDDGKGNVHKNYNYALIQNQMNLKELDKISISVKLDHPNFNFYKLQKIPFEIIFDKPGGNQTSLRHKRISGECLITNIEYISDSGKTYQMLTLVKRELEADDEEKQEAEKSTDDAPKQEETFENNPNPLPPDDDVNIEVIEDDVEIEEEEDVVDDFEIIEEDVEIEEEEDVPDEVEKIEVEAAYRYITGNKFGIDDGIKYSVEVIVENNFNYPEWSLEFGSDFSEADAEKEVKFKMDNFGEYVNNSIVTRNADGDNVRTNSNDLYPKTGTLIEVRS